MSNETNKARVRTYIDELWNKGNLNSEGDFLAADIVVHEPSSPGEIISLVGVASMLRAAMPDLVLVNEHLFGDGDRVVQHWVASGVHSGAALLGVPARNHKLTVSGVNMFRLVDGKISEQWSIMDTAGLMQQLQAN